MRTFDRLNKSPWNAFAFVLWLLFGLIFAVRLTGL
jgi:hypothetical protein